MKNKVFPIDRKERSLQSYINLCLFNSVDRSFVCRQSNQVSGNYEFEFLCKHCHYSHVMDFLIYSGEVFNVSLSLSVTHIHVRFEVDFNMPF